MRAKCRFIVWGATVSFVSFFFALLICANFCLAATIHVPGDQLTIQAGIDAAVDGDTVLIADGTYTGDGNRDINFGGRLIVVKSVNGPESTIIDCEGSQADPHRGFYFSSGEDETAVVEGLTITHGWNIEQGGGMHCRNSSPTILNCHFIANYSFEAGGAIAIYNGSTEINNCDFTGNYALGEGGAIYCNGTALIQGCTFYADTSYWGGGAIDINGSATITDCIFNENVASHSIEASGALYCSRGLASISDCLFQSNEGGNGAVGAIYCEVIITNSLFFNNESRSWLGSTIGCMGGTISVTNCTLNGNIQYSGESASGILLHYGAILNLTNTIITNGTGASSPAVACDTVDTSGPPESVSIVCSNIWGNEGGDWVDCIDDQAGINGNISADPYFCNSDNGDFSLYAKSPCAGRVPKFVEIV